MALRLMIVGIALQGTVTATQASWLLETVAAKKCQAEDLPGTVRWLEDKIDRPLRARAAVLPIGQSWIFFL